MDPKDFSKLTALYQSISRIADPASERFLEPVHPSYLPLLYNLFGKQHVLSVAKRWRLDLQEELNYAKMAALAIGLVAYLQPSSYEALKKHSATPEVLLSNCLVFPNTPGIALGARSYLKTLGIEESPGVRSMLPVAKRKANNVQNSPATLTWEEFARYYLWREEVESYLTFSEVLNFKGNTIAHPTEVSSEYFARYLAYRHVQDPIGYRDKSGSIKEKRMVWGLSQSNTPQLYTVEEAWDEKALTGCILTPAQDNLDEQHVAYMLFRGSDSADAIFRNIDMGHRGKVLRTLEYGVATLVFVLHKCYVLAVILAQLVISILPYGIAWAIDKRWNLKAREKVRKTGEVIRNFLHIPITLITIIAHKCIPFLLTPGRTTIRQNSANLLSRLAAGIKSTTTTVRLSGHSLGAADAQNMAVILTEYKVLQHLLDKIDKGRPFARFSQKEIEDIAFSAKLSGEVTRRIIEQWRHLVNLESLDSAQAVCIRKKLDFIRSLEVYAWNAPGIQKSDNNSFVEMSAFLSKSDPGMFNAHIKIFLTEGDLVSQAGQNFLGDKDTTSKRAGFAQETITFQHKIKTGWQDAVIRFVRNFWTLNGENTLAAHGVPVFSGLMLKKEDNAWEEKRKVTNMLPLPPITQASVADARVIGLQLKRKLPNIAISLDDANQKRFVVHKAASHERLATIEQEGNILVEALDNVPSSESTEAMVQIMTLQAKHLNQDHIKIIHCTDLKVAIGFVKAIYAENLHPVMDTDLRKKFQTSLTNDPKFLKKNFTGKLLNYMECYLRNQHLRKSRR